MVRGCSFCLRCPGLLPAAPLHPPQQPSCLLPPSTTAFTTNFARLSALASAAAQQADPRPPVAVDTALGPVLIPAAAVAGPPLPVLPPGIDRAPVVWQPPLPAALRKYLPPEAAAAVGGGGGSAPLPVGAPPAEAEIQVAAFQPRQYGRLYRLLHQHSQLLIQVRLGGCWAVWVPDLVCHELQLSLQGQYARLPP